ncbi:hypothetical protein F4808DRAFT_469309 [Astrocystis sublimbata]|nr:hypothetical protein F4808DRAFT_469309 [Astrocystis sublimbata]
MFAEGFLLESLCWELSERRRARKYNEQYRPFPLPSPETRHFELSDVSVVVATVSWDPAIFSAAINSWLANKPLEIIIVTTDAEIEALYNFVQSDKILAASAESTEVSVYGISYANKRDQIVEGIRYSRGRIVCLAGEDVVWKEDALLHLLAPFEEDDIGLVGGPVEPYLPEDRRDPTIIKPYEVATLRNCSKHRAINKGFYACEGSTDFTVSGATMLLHPGVAKDPVFQHEFMTETFAGIRLDSGDDAFITKWVLFQHLREDRKYSRVWGLGMQLTPEATVYRTIRRDGKFIDQMKQWSLTRLHFRLCYVFRDPGLWNFYYTKRYMCRNMLEGLYDPFLNLLWYVCFLIVAYRNPLVAVLLAVHYLYQQADSIDAFAYEFPYCREQIWVAVLADKVALFFDLYCWVTLPLEIWRASRRRKLADADKMTRELDLDE